MSRYECDCGTVYSHPDLVIACACHRPPASRPIPFTEREPEPDTWVLAFDSHTGNWAGFDFDHDNSAEWMISRGYTHWMPQPPEPK